MRSDTILSRVETVTSVAERDGVHLHFRMAGTGEPALVFVHGWCCDSTSFHPQFEYFKASRRVVALDLAGFGQSSSGGHTFEISAFADDVAWMCGHVGIVKPVVIGHSLGGAIAIEVAARHPSLPSAIIAAEPGPIARSPEITKVLTSLLTELRGPRAEDVRRNYVQNVCFSPGDDLERKNRLVEIMCSVPIDVAALSLQKFLQWDGVSALRDCHAPLLVLLASIGLVHDPPRLRTINPEIHFGVTVGAGHFHQLDVPEQVTPMIERFLQITGLAHFEAGSSAREQLSRD